MSTGDKSVNIYLKKFISQQEMTDNFQILQNKLLKDSIKRVYGDGGVFIGGDLSSSVANTVTLSTPLEGYNNEGREAILNPSEASNIPFENTSLGVYFIGVKPIEVWSDVERNVKTGLLEYRLSEEIVGIRADPNVVVDNGDGTLTVTVDSVTEAAVTNAGRTVRIFLKARQDGGALGPQTEAVPFEDVVVTWDGSNNLISTTTALGQQIGSISVDPNDYEVVLIGPTITKVDLRLDKSVIYLGFIIGNFGLAPTFFYQFDRRFLGALSPSAGEGFFVDVRTLLQGGGTVSHDDSVIGRMTFSADLEIRPLGSNDVMTIAASSIDLADDEVAYAELPIPTTSGGILLFKTPRSDVSLLSSNKFWIFHRNGSVVNSRGGLQFEQGEKRQLDDIVISNSIYFSNDDKIRFDEANNLFHFDADGAANNAGLALGLTIYHGAITNNDKVLFTEGATPKWEVITNNVVRLKVDENGDVVASRNITGTRDVLSQTGTNYIKDSDASVITSVDASLNEVSDATINRKLLNITANNPADTLVNVSGASITKANGSSFVLQNGVSVLSYTGGTIDFSTGIITGGGANFTAIDFSGQASKWAKYVITLLSDNTIAVIQAVGFGASQVAAPDPSLPTSDVVIAIIAVQDNGSAGVGTILNLTETNFEILASSNDTHVLVDTITNLPQKVTIENGSIVLIEQ